MQKKALKLVETNIKQIDKELGFRHYLITWREKRGKHKGYYILALSDKKSDSIAVINNIVRSWPNFKKGFKSSKFKWRFYRIENKIYTLSSDHKEGTIG